MPHRICAPCDAAAGSALTSALETSCGQSSRPRAPRRTVPSLPQSSSPWARSSSTLTWCRPWQPTTPSTCKNVNICNRLQAMRQPSMDRLRTNDGPRSDRATICTGGGLSPSPLVKHVAIFSLSALFCSVLEFGPVPTSPTPLLQGAPVRLRARARGLRFKKWSRSYTPAPPTASHSHVGRLHDVRKNAHTPNWCVLASSERWVYRVARLVLASQHDTLKP